MAKLSGLKQSNKGPIFSCKSCVTNSWSGGLLYDIKTIHLYGRISDYDEAMVKLFY